MSNSRVIVVGAGMGGLSAAMRLAASGCDVTVFESASAPGGKMRTLPSDAGPVDAGPTVLTLRDVFDDLFTDCGMRLDDHVTLEAETVLARHFWPDGSRLDLHADHDRSVKAIHDFAGARAAKQFRAFHAETDRLFRAFDAPMMRSAKPSLVSMILRVAADPALMRAMTPLSTLAQRLGRRFDDPRLVQLFGRYATYVGGLPQQVPGLLALIWQAESRGVWRVQGGMHRLARAMADAAERLGATVVYDTPVARIEDGPFVVLADGTRHPAEHVVFNGDPRALRQSLLGPNPAHAVKQSATEPRSLSAEVWAFAATPHGPDLHHHNVFFGADYTTETELLAQGGVPHDPTVYICAMDHGTGRTPPALERFETIVNAAPLPHDDSEAPCYNQTFQTLAERGLTFTPTPNPATRTTPQGFAALFPGSLGSIYGRSPSGTMAAFQRPTARTAMKGLILAGGGAHPGAGVPMAALSGKQAAEAIISARTSTLPSRRTATPGGTSTGSATTVRAPSRSSGS
ncbi:Hydroxyneurosporene desaturase [Rhodobacteraceae bacterium THAF1]|uniref:1-hydroxycarotenoid 3,4-desaturase CrtD n=1 Tax=Palleronia sp. THAF1 TaxID=2587842 RepID=UPI000F41A106|nr:1-hydroxycarotenoid 3,4-desaturase CrtD [Palleronia sp. THAF1]QFU09761.1 Hydroxyneurosporene desaturase [Palleronia sp. THAF1]VDC17336.1 Hydroxyneurosporene desaturase [Rhodobacteraceae bacterium THAF1]